MKVKFSAVPPQPASDTMHALLVTEETLDAAKALMAESYEGLFELYTKHWKEGKTDLFLTPDRHFVILGLGKKDAVTPESIRKAVSKAVSQANNRDRENLVVCIPGTLPEEVMPTRNAAEAIVLANYQFLPYKSKPKKNALRNATVVSEEKKGKAATKTGVSVAEATKEARDLVNEPVMTLTAVEMGSRIEKLGKKYGFSVEVFNKAKIQALKMGGLLAVNLGSQDPPTFSILEWKPKKPKNKKPLVLVGKGVVYDTGGLSLKPTANSMDFMKSDMGGAAAVIGAMCGISALELDYHVIGLVPATDNRPGEKAYTPGDVITMYDGTSVEVLNTDAEGRLLLADALAYAKKYDPELVIDLATLTGAAVVAVGNHGIALMSSADEETKSKIAESGQFTYERTVELPLWKEYGDALKSDIADLKNIGGRPAGSITAGKFLEHFTDYPWVHLDIAGPAFRNSSDGYLPKGGSGVGVRLLTHFIEQLSS